MASLPDRMPIDVSPEKFAAYNCLSFFVITYHSGKNVPFYDFVVG
jgi:hypothetical protein